jgi:putative hemolysin
MKIDKSLSICFIFIFWLMSLQVALALMNPASVYCSALGYNYSVKDGSCIFPDGSKVDAWKFLLGEEKQEYSYCARQGYEVKIIKSEEECSLFLTESCAGCLLPNGSVIEVTKLMGLSFVEGVCGDRRCVIGESYKNCPQDCPSGSRDGYCDEVKDGICDEDCLLQNITEKDPDCPFCGNKICDKGENNLNCPQDCPVCGNKICEFLENQTTCCLDCGCSENLKCIENKCLPCGNNKCDVELGENYKLCPKDCPSGSKDNYCDAITDGRCDPDCKEKEDIDCIKPIASWIYFVIAGVVIGLIILLIVWSKRT